MKKKKRKKKVFRKKYLKSWKIGFWEKKVGKQKAKYFCEKNFGKKYVWEFYTKKHFWTKSNN